MAFVALRADESYNPYRSQSIITKVDYPYCKLFYKYHHEPKQSFTARWVRVYYDYYRKWYDNLQYYLAGFSNDPYVVLHAHTKNPHTFVSADVYFNRYHNEPLLVVLESGTSKVYYPRSDFDPDIKNYRHKNLDTLFPFKDEKTLLQKLIEENDKVDKVLTYQVEKTGYSSYNGDKIKLTRYESYSESEKHFKDLIYKLKPNGFFCFRHEPYRKFATLKSYFLFNSEVLMGKDKKPIEQIQGHKYNMIVYWSNKVRDPLLVEFNEGGHTYSNDLFNLYFIVRKGNEGLYFERLHNRTPEIMDLVISPHGQMYEILSYNNHQIMIRLLKKLESYMINKVYVLLNKTTKYTKKEVEHSLNLLKNNVLYPQKYKIPSAQPENINVHQKRDCVQLLSPDYECFEQEIIINTKIFLNYFFNRDTIQLLLLAPTFGNPKNCIEINLYMYDTTDKNMKQIYHEYYVDSNIKFYVFFYKGKYDTPLLFCYNENAYAPENKNSYNKWVKVEEIDSCSCSNNTQILDQLKRLSQLILGIVPIKIHNSMESGHQKKKQEIHQEKDPTPSKTPLHPKTQLNQTFIQPPRPEQPSQGRGRESTATQSPSKENPPPGTEKPDVRGPLKNLETPPKPEKPAIITKGDTIRGIDLLKNVSDPKSGSLETTPLKKHEVPPSGKESEDHSGTQERETISTSDTTSGKSSGHTSSESGSPGGVREQEMQTRGTSIDGREATGDNYRSGESVEDLSQTFPQEGHTETEEDRKSQISSTDSSHLSYQASNQAASPNGKNGNTAGLTNEQLAAAIVVPVLIVKGVTIGLLLAKFPYIIFPSIKALI